MLTLISYAVSTSSGAVDLDCTSHDNIQALARSGAAISIGAVREGALLEVQERGQAVEVLAPARSFVAQIGIPLRYGRFIVGPTHGEAVRVRKSEPNAAKGTFSLRMRCIRGLGTDNALDWWKRLGELASRARTPLDKAAAAQLSSELDGLDAETTLPGSHALLQHVRAQTLLMSGQYALASDAFARAEVAWRVAGDRDRAAVARVGQAEEAQRIGNYARVLELAPPPGDSAEGLTYFDIRLATSRCIALDYLGRYAESDTCYAWALLHLKALDERIDYANTLRNHAYLRWEMGQTDDAEAIAAQALDAATGPNAPIVKGRVYSMLADIHASRGDVVHALRDADAALGDFIEARSQRWQVDALLKIASIYGELGAYDDAYVAIRKAVEQMSPKDTPARVGAALIALAEVDLANGVPDRALKSSRSAQDIYARLAMPAEREEAQWMALRAELARNDSAAVERGLAALDAATTRHRADRALIAANLAVLRGDASAPDALDALHDENLRLPDRVRARTIEASYWRSRGDIARSDRILADALSQMRDLVRATRSPILRHMLSRVERPLLDEAFHGLLSGTTQPTAEAAWRWLALSGTGAARERGTANARAADRNPFDAAVAQELLGIASAATPPGAKREIVVEHDRLALFAQSNGAPPMIRPGAPTLADVRAALYEGAVLVTYLDGITTGALLIATSSSATIIDSMGPDALGQQAADIRAMLQTPDTPASEIDAAARALSSRLWSGIPPGAPPRRMLVLAGGALDSLPLPLLYWPGANAPLAERTAIEIVDLDVGGDAKETAHANPDALHVVVAAQRSGASESLPTLFNAEGEPAEIRRAAPGLAVTVDEASAASRESVLALLDRPASWVHIAAHGSAEPNRLGYAGVWLDPPSDGRDPEFLSWLEVLDRGVRSDLVVLNACSLADSGDASRNNLSFASAVSQAGARQVVAALWPLSDSASAIWVPAFYAALMADPRHDAADAILAAQRALRGSRLFRHPYYWAGFKSFGRLDVVAQPARVSAPPRGSD